jgi:hypothetical protein
MDNGILIEKIIYLSKTLLHDEKELEIDDSIGIDYNFGISTFAQKLMEFINEYEN